MFLRDSFDDIVGEHEDFLKVVEAPLEAAVPTFMSFGMSEHIAQLLREMYEGIANGKGVAQAGEHVRGTTSLETTRAARLSR